MSLDSWSTRIFAGTGAMIMVLGLAGLYTGASGDPLSLLVFSLAFALNVACMILGGLGSIDPDLPHEWLKIELPRWAWAIAFVPYSGAYATIAWMTYSP